MGVEKLNLKTEKDKSIKLNLEVTDLNEIILELNTKLSQLQEALSISSVAQETNEIEIRDLKIKLDEALKEKIGELSEYRSEFFGRLKQILKDQKKINVVGDRFVLQSEILFKSGSAEIGEIGKKKLIEISTY